MVEWESGGSGGRGRGEERKQGKEGNRKRQSCEVNAEIGTGADRVEKTEGRKETVLTRKELEQPRLG